MTATSFTSAPFLTGIVIYLLLFCEGCASWTNPVANGVPARLLPEELLAERKEDLEPLPLTWLRRKPERVYRLAPGDILGVYIEGVLGETDKLPPIHFPDVANLVPSVGFPIPIREDGTVPLPLVKPIPVDNLTIEEAEDAIIQAYTVGKQIIRLDESRVLVTLVSPRTSKIRVVREDSGSGTGGVLQNFGGYNRSAPLISQRAQGRGLMVTLPATEADVLGVLAESGGLPGPGAVNEIIIQRGYSSAESFRQGRSGTTSATGCKTSTSDYSTNSSSSIPGFVRIPMRWPPGVPPPFEPEDIALKDGDIVFVPARDYESYYTGGLLPPREVPLPRDYDLGVVEAVLRIGGPLINGGVNANNLQGAIVAPGLGFPSPSLLSVLRHTPDGRQVNIRVDLNKAAMDPRENILIQEGDVLILQETPQEALARYVSGVFRFSFFGELFRGASGFGTVTGSVP